MSYSLSGNGCRFWHHYSLPVVFALLLCVQSGMSAAQSLTLAEATQRTLATNPELQVFRWRLHAIEGLRQTAGLSPPFELGLEAENLAGSGELSGVDNAELTLSLSSVIELGGKRGSRMTLADSHHDLVQAEQQAKALDLLGRVAQGFIVSLSLQKKLEVAQEATLLADHSYQLVSARVKHGAAPEAERLRAQAALKQASMQQEALAAELESRKFALASLWHAQHADFTDISGDLFNFDKPTSFDALYQRVAASPAIAVFASKERLLDAELALARSQSTSNVRWTLGLRRDEGMGDTALTAGVAIPLLPGRRNRGEVQSALAEREMVQYRRDAARIAIRARLFEAWQSHRQSAAAARQMREEVLPALEQALVQTRQAYQRGRYSYVDWVSAQRELLDARMAAIDAATTALLNQALIEQLTAEPLAADKEQALDQTTGSPRR